MDEQEPRPVGEDELSNATAPKPPEEVDRPSEHGATAPEGSSRNHRLAAQRIRGVATRLRTTANELRAEDSVAAHAIERASRRIERLATAVGAAGSEGAAQALRRIVRELPGIVLGCPLLLARAALRLSKRSKRGAKVSASPLAQPLDDSGLPHHDGPSGYFSARAEGVTKNTTASTNRPLS